MELPEALRTAIEVELAQKNPKKLAQAAGELSLRYRQDRADGKTLLRSEVDVQAYAAFRLPATFAAAHAVMSAIQEALPGWRPENLLDAGAGPGAVMWAAAACGWDFSRITLIERESSMIELGKCLAQAGSSGIRTASWVKADLSSDMDIPSHDLVTAAYVLGELDQRDREVVLDRLWQGTRTVLAIIEPGTPQGFERIRQMRQQLVEKGAVILAPCPHDQPCPLSGSDWCHFAERVARTKLHRLVKGGELAYEDEKFSYVAASRFPGSRAAGRILRHPQVRKGHIIFSVCTGEGISTKVISRSDGQAYRRAKKLKWGSAYLG